MKKSTRNNAALFLNHTLCHNTITTPSATKHAEYISQAVELLLFLGNLELQVPNKTIASTNRVGDSDASFGYNVLHGSASVVRGYAAEQLLDVTFAEHLVGILVVMVHVGREVRGHWTIRSTFAALESASSTSLVLLHT